MRYGTGVGLVVSAGLLWSLQGLVFRQIAEAGPWAILFWRSLGMVPVLAAFVLFRSGGRPLASLRGVGLAGVLGGLGLVGAFGGAVVAIQATTVANAVFLFAAAPFLTALLGWAVLGERLAPSAWAAIALALVGIAVMVGGSFAGGSLAGNAAALTSAAGFAVFTVALRWRQLDDMMPAILLGSLFALAFGAAMAVLAGEGLAVTRADALWSMAMGGGLLSGGLVLYTLGSRAIPAAELALLAMVEVMLSPVWVWLFLGETAGATTLAGGAIILAAIAFNALAGARRGARAGRALARTGS